MQKDRDRLERIVKSTAEPSTKSSAPQVCIPAYTVVYVYTVLSQVTALSFSGILLACLCVLSPCHWPENSKDQGWTWRLLHVRP